MNTIDKVMTPRDWMEMAIESSKKSVQDKDHKTKKDPLVGIVIVNSDGKEYDISYRAEGMDGCHAEYTLLYERLKSYPLDDFTLYVTLEPCSPESRTGISCTEVVIDKRIKHIYIGMLDPNPEISGKALRRFFDEGITVHPFDEDLRNEIIELNKEFVEGFQGDETELGKIYHDIEFYKLKQDTLSSYYEKHQTIKNDFDLIREMVKQRAITKNGKKYQANRDFLMAFGDYNCHGYTNTSIMMMHSRSKYEKNSVEFNGPLMESYNELLKFLDGCKFHKADNDSSEDRFLIDYTLIREAFVNAVIHRCYGSSQYTYVILSDDFLTIKNPVNHSETKIKEIINMDTTPYPVNVTLVELFKGIRLMDVQGKGLETFKKLPKTLQPIIGYQDKNLQIKLKY